jgi:hypothetical protein
LDDERLARKTVLEAQAPTYARAPGAPLRGYQRKINHHALHRNAKKVERN